MKIGIDLRSLEGGAQHRGIGRYATSLIEALSHIDHENEYVFFVSHKSVKVPTFDLHKNFKHRHAAGRGQGLRGIKYIRIIYITPRPLPVDRYDVDVFFQIDPFQPVTARRTPVVTVAYDLIPFIYKDLYQHVHLGGKTPGHLIGYSRQKLYWRVLETWIQRYREATRVVSISEHTKRDIIRFVPKIDPDRIVAIPLAAGPLPPPSSATPKSIKRLGLKRFVFYIGGADPRKGLVPFVKSLETVWQKFPDLHVVLAGKEITDPDVPEAVKLQKAAEASSRPDQIIRLGFISDEELAYFYRHAAAFIFPSRYEGFGLPILEAMQAGCPVITYDNSSLPEVAADAALVVPDGKPLAPALIKVLGSDTLRTQLTAKGKKQAASFTWEKTARATLNVITDAARDHSQKHYGDDA